MPDRVPERRQGDRRLRRVLIQMYVLYGVVVVLFVFTAASLTDGQNDTRRLAEQNARTARVATLLARQLNSAVCTWRAELRRRYRTTAEFLRDNPAGFPGVPLKTLTDGQRNLRRTIRSFRTVDCPR